MAVGFSFVAASVAVFVVANFSCCVVRVLLGGFEMAGLEAGVAFFSGDIDVSEDIVVAFGVGSFVLIRLLTAKYPRIATLMNTSAMTPIIRSQW